MSSVQLSVQELYIEKIDTNEGYAEISVGSTDIVCKYNYILHTVKMTEIIHVLNEFKNLNERAQNSTFKTLIDREISSIESLVHSIMPHRIKRGLANVGGRILNWAFGTLDDEDKEVIENHFSVIDENNGNIIRTINQQVDINDNFNRTLSHLKDIILKEREEFERDWNRLNNLEKNIWPFLPKNVQTTS